MALNLNAGLWCINTVGWSKFRKNCTTKLGTGRFCYHRQDQNSSWTTLPRCRLVCWYSQPRHQGCSSFGTLPLTNFISFISNLAFESIHPIGRCTVLSCFYRTKGCSNIKQIISRPSLTLHLMAGFTWLLQIQRLECIGYDYSSRWINLSNFYSSNSNSNSNNNLSF